MTAQLSVRDLEVSVRFYRDVLGAKVSRLRADFAAAQLGAAEVFLLSARSGEGPVTCCVLVDDADALFALYRERGAPIVEPPGDKPWGVREFTLRDPDGHRFRIGHSTR